MNESAPGARKRILIFAAVVESGTGLVLMVDPGIVARLLLGVELSGPAPVLGRCFGIALLALGLACWPRPSVGAPVVRGMGTYNALIALYLGWLGASGGASGVLLWPAVALHAGVALLLLWTGRRARAG